MGTKDTGQLRGEAPQCPTPEVTCLQAASSQISWAFRSKCFQILVIVCKSKGYDTKGVSVQ